MPEAPFGPRRPHPVADVPPAALADGQAPAKGWLLALVAARPLQRRPGAADARPRARRARRCARRSCARWAPTPSCSGWRPAATSPAWSRARASWPGAGGPAATVAAVAALRGALWEALTVALAPLDAPTTAALAERLAFVCDAVAAATLGGAGASAHAAGPEARGAARP